MTNLSDFRNKSQEQMIEYAVRMRKERDEALSTVERMTNHIHDLTGDGTGWWECACGYRTSTNLDQRLAAAEERTRIVLDAKDYWKERALKAEGLVADADSALTQAETASREATP